MSASDWAADTSDVRVRFGDRPTQTMALEWAENMLSRWAERQPAQFGAALAEAATGVAVSPRRSRRKDGDGQAEV